jgi:beta-glucanase (GH16 family)
MVKTLTSSGYYMKHLLWLGAMLTGIIIYSGCTKDNDSSVPAPSNLTLTSDISSDGSGNVSFTAVADNAVSYDFDFGNGDTKQKTSGTAASRYFIGGTNTYSVTVTAYNSTGLSIKKTEQISVTVAGEQGLFWSDDFNTDGAPDPLKWGYDIGTGSGGWGNAELEYYTSRSENVIVKDGLLKITAKRESYNGSQFTSTRMLTMNKFSFTYGKVVVRAKLPATAGTWPAVWMLGSNIDVVGWPACGEIDIMEHRGSELNKIFGTLHYPGRSGGNANGNTKDIQNASTEFHTYKLEWTAQSIKIFVDDELYHNVTNSTSLPFNRDFFLIINLAMGGNFAGPVDQAFSSGSLEIDYIKVYKL